MLRAVLLVVLSILLPVQWSWAAAASTCDHRAETAHYGHHEHAGCAGDSASGAAVGDPAPDRSHPDCQQCHGVGVACLETASTASGPLPVASFASDVDDAFSEPPPERLLRPPLTLVA